MGNYLNEISIAQKLITEMFRYESATDAMRLSISMPGFVVAVNFAD